MGFFETVGKSIWEEIKPWAEAKWEAVEPKLELWVKEKLEEWFPKLAKLIVVTMASSAGEFVINVDNKIEHAIPGPVDDFVINTVEDKARDMLAPFGIHF